MREIEIVRLRAELQERDIYPLGKENVIPLIDDPVK